MKAILFIVAICFISLCSSAQTDAVAAAKQNISMRLHDIAIVEKRASHAAEMTSESASSLKIQAAGKWIITTKEDSNSTKKASQYNFVALPDDKEMIAKSVVTLSKI